MAEVGSGNGTSWPTALDVNAQPEVNAPAAGKTKARKEVVEDLTAICLKLEEIIGTSPQGSLVDVKTFLQTHHQTDGTHKTTHGPHKWIDAADYNTLTDAANAAIGKTLVIASSISLTLAEAAGGAVVIPATVLGVFPMAPGVINKNTATSFTCNAPIVGNPGHQWLSGFAAGNVGFGAMGPTVVYPEWFGAKGDDSTNDYAAINLAYQAVKNNNGAAVVLSKKYAYATALVLDSKVEVHGTHGRAWQANSSIDTFLLAALRYTGSGIAITCSDVSVLRNFALQGTSSATGGILLQTTGGHVMENMDVVGFSNTNAYGLKTNGMHLSKFNKVSFRGNYDGTLLSGNALTFSDCVWFGNARYGAAFDDTSEMSNLLMTNPVFQNNGGESLRLVEGSNKIYNPKIINIYTEVNVNMTGYTVHIEGASAGSLYRPSLDGGEVIAKNTNGNVAVYVKNTYEANIDTKTYSVPPTASTYSNAVSQFENGGGNVALNYPHHLSGTYEEYSGNIEGRRLPSALATGPFVSELITCKRDIPDNSATGIMRVTVPNPTGSIGAQILLDYVINDDGHSRWISGQERIDLVRYINTSTVSTIATTLSQVGQNATGSVTITLSFTLSSLTGGATETQTFDLNVIADTSDSSTTNIRYLARILNGTYRDTAAEEITLMAL